MYSSRTGGDAVKGVIVALSRVCSKVEVGENLVVATEVVDSDATCAFFCAGGETGFEFSADFAFILVLVMGWYVVLALFCRFDEASELDEVSDEASDRFFVDVVFAD